jgi:hypothetical protein
LSSFTGRDTRFLTAAIGVAGAVLLLMLKSKVDHDLLQKGHGMFQVQWGGGYVAAIILFIAAAVLSSGVLDQNPPADETT